MKKVIVSIFFVIASITMSCSQTPSASEQETVTGPGIKFEVLEHDYGTIKKGADGSFEFTFTNNGTEPLILSNVRSSCGCTVPEWPREPIEAGQQSAIKVKYDTKREGKFQKSITVTTNAKEEPIILEIKGEILPDAAATE